MIAIRGRTVSMLLSLRRFVPTLSLLVGLSLPPLSLAWEVPPWDGQNGVAAGESFVQVAVKTIHTEDSRRARTKQVVELSEWVSKHSAQVSQADIDALTLLLSDDDDAVRGWTAGALGILGERARSAAPDLQNALRDRPCEYRPLMSAAAIRLALTRMGIQPAYAPCLNTGP